MQHLKELNGATICVLTGTTLETNIADYNRANNIKISTLLFDKPEEAFAAADAGRCDGYTDDGGSVAAARSTMKKPDDWMFMPETIGGLQPLGSFTRQGDEAWTRLVKWVHYAMLEAEVLGITQANADQMAKDPKRPGRAPLSSAWKAISASCSASITAGPAASSRTSAITARYTRPPSARRRARSAARHEQPLLTRAACRPCRPGTEPRSDAEWQAMIHRPSARARAGAVGAPRSCVGGAAWRPGSTVAAGNLGRRGIPISASPSSPTTPISTSRSA